MGEIKGSEYHNLLISLAIGKQEGEKGEKKPYAPLTSISNDKFIIFLPKVEGDHHIYRSRNITLNFL